MILTASDPASLKKAPKTLVPFILTGDHPYLTEIYFASIRTFLRKYDQCVNEIVSRARQFNEDSETERGRPVDNKFCNDVDFLDSSIDLDFIKHELSYDTTRDQEERAFPEERPKNSRESMTVDKLDKLVANELRTNMKNSNTIARMQDLISQYQTILRRNGMK